MSDNLGRAIVPVQDFKQWIFATPLRLTVIDTVSLSLIFSISLPATLVSCHQGLMHRGLSNVSARSRTQVAGTKAVTHL